jgi:hypothetical protein
MSFYGTRGQAHCPCFFEADKGTGVLYQFCLCERMFFQKFTNLRITYAVMYYSLTLRSQQRLQ